MPSIQNSAQPPPRQLASRRRIGTVDHQPQLVLPAPRRAERVELVLADDVRREPVRVGPGVALGVRQQVDLAMGLLERLGDLLVLENPPPRRDLVDAPAGGMPQADLGRLAVLDRGPFHVGGPPVDEEHRSAVDAPEQSPRDRADQRVIEIALAPLLEGPGLLEQEHRIDPVALRRQHRLDVLERLLELLELVLVLRLHLGRDRLRAPCPWSRTTSAQRRSR